MTDNPKPLHRLRRYLKSPFTQLAMGLILLLSGLSTTYYEFIEADHSFRLGVHHGIVLWALVQVLGSLPNLVDGLARSFEAIETHHGA